MLTLKCLLLTLHNFRFVHADDFNWFTKTMLRVATEEFGEELATEVEPTRYFVDFLR